MKLLKLLLFGLVGTLMFVGCEKKEVVPTLKTGTYSYTDADNNIFSIELTDETITFHDDTLKFFDTNETIYVFKKISSEVNELRNEGIEMSEDEKNKRKNELSEEVDYSIWSNAKVKATEGTKMLHLPLHKIAKNRE